MPEYDGLIAAIASGALLLLVVYKPKTEERGPWTLLLLQTQKLAQYFLVVVGINAAGSGMIAMATLFITAQFTSDQQTVRYVTAGAFFICFVLLIHPLMLSVRRIRGELPPKPWSL